MPRENFLKSINSLAPCCESHFYFLLIEAHDITLLELTNSYGLKVKNRFKKIIIGRDPGGMLLLDHPLCVQLNHLP